MKRITVLMTLLALFPVLIIANSIPPAFAWTLGVGPGSRTVAPGGTTSFTITVSGAIAGNPNVMLLVSPPILGISTSFTANNVPSPFTSTMVVSVDPSKAPGTYDIPVWAHPASVLFPGPGNMAAGAHLIVGSTFDFSLTLSPPSISVKQGDTASYQISITYSDPSYSGTSISVDVGVGPGMNYQVIPSPPTLNVLTSQATTPGSYTITLTGSAMGVVHTTSALLVVQPPALPFDFSISASPIQQTVTPGASTTYSITVGLVSGTSQNVVLAVSGSVPSGVSTSLNPTSGLPSFNSILSISTTSTAAPGQYVMTITGTAGTTTHSATITLTIGQAPDFRIDVNPASQTVVQGQAASYSLNVVGINGFNSQVSLSVTGLPSGANGVFTTTSGTPNFPSTLTVTLANNVPAGSYTLVIHGTGGGLDRTANAVLIITATPTQTQTQSQTTTQSAITTTGGLVETLQQNSLILIGALALLVIVLAALAMRGRGRRAAPQQMAQSQIFCGKCGSENPASNEFCMKCGNKLKGS